MSKTKTLRRLLSLALALCLCLTLLPVTAGAEQDPPPATVTIAAFDTLADEILYQSCDAGDAESAAALSFPDTLTGTDMEGIPVTVAGVKWESDPPFDPDKEIAYPGYELQAVLPEGYTLADGATAPVITVFVRPAGGVPFAPVDNAASLVDTINNYASTSGGTANNWLATAEGNIVTVTGSITGANKTLTLDIDPDVTVKWEATLVGNADSYSYLVIISGNGAFEVATGGEVSTTIGGVIQANGANSTVTVSGGVVSTTRPTTGVAIDANGINSTVTVKGTGKVLATTDVGSAIYSEGNVIVMDSAVVSATDSWAIDAGTVTVSGGVVSATTGKAICTRLTGSTITVSGGVVSATDGLAIDAKGTVTVSGGVVFAYGSDITGGTNVILSPGFTSATGTGVVIAWDKATAGSTPTYMVGDKTHLLTDPTEKAVWAISDTEHGIRYNNDTNSGFIKIDDVMVTPLPPSASNVDANAVDPVVGTQLTGSYTYIDETGTENGTTFKWYRGDTATWDTANPMAISGATAITYTPTGADVGKYLYFEVTPSNDTHTGTAVQSAASGQAGIMVSLVVVANGSTGTATINGGIVPVKVVSTTAPTLAATRGDSAAVAWTVMGGGTLTNEITTSPTYTLPTMNNSVTGPITITATFHPVTTLSAVSVNITAPVTGAKPQTAEEVEAATSAAGYYVSTITWNGTMTAGGKFAAETEYSATIILRAYPEYKFQAAPFVPTIDGAMVVNTTTSGGDVAGNIVSFTAGFNATAAKAVTNISVKSQPAKLSYTEGETLDLSGLTATITYNDDTTADVGYADFGTHTPGAITMAYSGGGAAAHGDSLTMATHHNNTITLTCNGQTANTNPLTVTTAVSSTVTIVSSDTVGEIETKIANALNVHNTVTVTGSKTDADAFLTLNIPAGKTLEWKAELSGSTGFSNGLVNIYGDGAFEVATGGKIEQTGAGISILAANDAALTVSGGTVSSTTGMAINTYGTGSTVTVSGGAVSTTTGTAIYAKNTVTVSGGMVRTAGGAAIYAENTVTVSGGLVFGYHNTIVGGIIQGDAISSGSFNTIGTGVVIAWDENAGSTTYIEGRTDDLDMLPTGAAYWDTDGSDKGIRYANGVNVGFIKIDGITINPSSSSATAADVTISGTVNTLLPTQTAIITLANDTLSSALTGTDVAGWFTGIPTGVTATASGVAGSTTITITFGGTPTEVSSAAFSINIPGSALASNTALAVTANPEAKFSITAPIPDTVTIVSSDTVGEIETKIANALNVHNTVTVTGSKTDADAFLTLNIPAGKTVEWKAELSGSTGSNIGLVDIYGDGAFEVATGGKIEQTGAGIAIRSAANAAINISGGMVGSTTGMAINTYGTSSTVAVSDGMVSTTTGAAIYAKNTVTVSGGTVRAAGGAAITADNTVTISGGLVFGYRNVIIGGLIVGNYTVTNTGVVIAWNKSAGNTTYTAGSTDDLDISTAGTAVYWKNNGSDNGIAYGSSGFIPTAEVITITPSTVTGTIQVNNSGSYTNIGQVKAAIEGALVLGNTAEVTGTMAEVDASLILNIPAGKTVSWAAALAAENSFTDNLIDLRGDGDFKVITGAQITAANSIAIYGNSSGNITVSGGVVSGSISGSGSAVIKIVSSSSTLTVSGTGKVQATADSTAISSTGEVTVTGNAEITSRGYGISITTSKITVNGGTVLALVPIRLAGTNPSAIINGGQVISSASLAIYADSATAMVTVNGGAVFAKNSTLVGTEDGVIRMVTMGNYTGPSANGVVIAWDKPGSPPPYTAGLATDLTVDPSGKAQWAISGTDSGISYNNGTAVGFFKVDDVTVSGTPTPYNATVNITVDGATANVTTVKYGTLTADTAMALGATGTYTAASVAPGTYKIFVNDVDTGFTFNSATAVTVPMFKVTFAANATGSGAGAITAAYTTGGAAIANNAVVVSGTSVTFTVATTAGDTIAWGGGASGSTATAAVVYSSIKAQVTCALTAAPTPAYTVTAVPASAAPVAGVVNGIVFTVKDSGGIKDTTFNGWKDVTIKGVAVAPNNSYGSLNGTQLTADSVSTGQVIQVSFSYGEASVPLFLNKAGTAQNITFSVAGVATPLASGAVSITPVAAAVDSLTLTTAAVTGQRSGTTAVAFITQPVITLKDAFGNVCANGVSENANVIISVSSSTPSGATLGGTLSVNAVNGVAAFSGVTVIPGDDNDITDLDLTYTAGGKTVNQDNLTMSDSATPAYTVTAVPASSTPVAGAANNIVFTVMDSGGTPDTSFAGAKNVTIKGVSAAPDGSYGSFGGTALTADSVSTGQTILVGFTSGVATVPLALNKAAAQTVTFEVEGVATTLASGTGAITPTFAAASKAKIATQPAGAVSGTALTTQPVIHIVDAYENLVTSSTLVVTATVTTNGTGTPAITAGNTRAATGGIATFSGLTLTGASNGVVLTFTPAGLTGAASSAFNVAAAPLTQVTYTATQVGGVSGTADSTGILITFSADVSGLTAADITITGATRGTLTDNGDADAKTWLIAISNISVANGGNATIDIADFGTFDVTTAQQSVTVYKNTQTPPPATTAPTITTASLPSGTVNVAYSQTLTAAGTTPITWGVSSGSLPGGLSLSTAGVISGTPTASGTFSFTVKAANGTAPDATKALSIIVNSNNNNNGGGGGGGGGSTTPTTPTTPSAPETGDNKLTTPKGQDPVVDKNGNTTLPGGGTVETPGGAEIDLPAGTTIDKDGNVTIPPNMEAEVTLPGGTEITLPGGTTVDKDGDITVPQGKTAETTLPGGTEITLPGGSTISNNGHITTGGSTQANLPGGAAVNLPQGSTISNDGKITVGAGGATVHFGGGTNSTGNSFDAAVPLAAFPGSTPGFTLSIIEGTTLILDQKAPLGYYVSAGNPFKDVISSDWFYDNAMFAYTHGLMNGTGANTFSSNATLTRAMFITILARLTGVDTEGGETWYSKAVAWAIAEGITDGQNLHSPITREQMAAMLQRYAQLSVPTEPAQFADDSNISSYAREAVYAMQAAGVITGKPGNIIDPQGHATRAEAAAMLQRLIEASGK